MSPTISPPNSLEDAAVTKQQQVNTWDDVNKRAKALESEIDTQLLGLSRLTSAALRSGQGSSYVSEAERLTEQIEVSLRELVGLIDELSRMTSQQQPGSGGDSSRPLLQQHLPPSHSTSHLIQRHRDIHMEYVKELRKAKTHLAACLQTGPQPSASTSTNYYFREADRVNTLSGVADHIIKYSFMVLIV